MKTSCCITFLLSCVAFVAIAEKIDYNEHKVVQVVPKSKIGMRLLEKLEALNAIKFWTEPTTLNRPASFQISGSRYEGVARMLADRELNPTVLIDNIQELIDRQDRQIQMRKLKFKADGGRAFDFENFHTYAELVAFMQDTAANNALVTYSVIGKSYEGRDIGQVLISTGVSPTKQIIFLECGIHAREWVSPSSCIWIFDQLASGYGVNPDVTPLLDKYDWIIVPSSNPDGYDFTWTSDRLWRKNRAPTGNVLCPGVDLNRNYDANFGGDGSSPLACSETYHGPAAFSESESMAIRDSLEANRGRVKAYVSIHSYAGIWMSPYGYVNTLPVEYPEMYRVMQIGVNAIAAVNGTVFDFGNEANLLYLTSGTTRDYAYVGQNILYPYTIEARSRDYGFVAPPSEILVTAQEIWSGVKAMADAVV